MKSAGSISYWYVAYSYINYKLDRLQITIRSERRTLSLVFGVCKLREICLFQIIDSLTHPFRTDYCGRGELADRQQKLGQVLSRLQKVAEGRCPTTLCCSSNRVK